MNDVSENPYTPIIDYLESRDLKPLFPPSPLRSEPKTFASLNEEYAEQKLEKFGYSPTHLKKLGPQSFKFSKKNQELVAKFQHTPDIILQYLLPRIIINDEQSSEKLKGEYKFSKYVSNYLTRILQNNVNEYSLKKRIKDPIDFFEQVFPKTFSNSIPVGNFLDIPLSIHQYHDDHESIEMKKFRKNIENGFLNEDYKAPNNGLGRHACIPTLPEETKMGLLVSEYHGSDFGKYLHNSIGNLDKLTTASQNLGETIAFFNSHKIILGDNLLSNYTWNGNEVVRIDPIHFIEYEDFHDSFLTLREIKVSDKVKHAVKDSEVNLKFALNQFVSVIYFMQEEIGRALIGEKANSKDASELKFSNVIKKICDDSNKEKDIHYLTTYSTLKFLDSYIINAPQDNGYLTDAAAYLGQNTYSKLNELYKFNY